jgi:phosphoribosyl-dephospho-CoA transferase
MELRPHDLLQIRGMEDLISALPFPGLPISDPPFPDPPFPDPPFSGWVETALQRVPWVVVRRATGEPGLVPVGIRGRERGQRFAAWLSTDKILQIVPPAALVDPAGWKSIYPAGQLPQPLTSLQLITPILEDTGYDWGPTGSLAFELATGLPSTKESSDLDILLHVPAPISVAAARSLLAAMEAVSLVRLDVQLNTPAGGVALKEYIAAGRVLVKTALAPVLREASTLWE